MDTEIKPVDTMTERELLMELVSTVRELSAAAAALQNSGMMGMLGGMFSGGNRKR